MINQKTKMTNTARDIMHYIVGFTFAYCIVNATGIFEMVGFQKIIMGFVAGFFTSAIIGVGIEYFQNVSLKQNFNEKDVLRTVVGGLIGGIIGSNFKDLHFITAYMLIGCIILIIAEVIRIIIFKRKRNGSKNN